MVKNFNIILLLFSLLIHGTQSFANEIPEDKDTLLSVGEASAKELNPQNINILVWNLQKAKKPDFEDALEDQARGKDILILQEAVDKPLMTRVFQELEDFGFSIGLSFIGKDGIGTGVATGSRFAPTQVNYQRSEDLEGNGRLTPKIILFSQFSLQGQDEKLLVINIHALNIVSDSIQKKQIRRAMEVANNHEGPVIFAGDFNSWGPIRSAKLPKYMADNGFVEVKYPSDEGRTEGLGVGGYLDHIFIRGLGVESSLVRNDWKGSDHTALEASLYLQKPSSMD